MIVYDYPKWYPVLGLRVRGLVGRMWIMKWYWYGRRVDAYVPIPSPHSAAQVGHWRDIGYARSHFEVMPQAWKAEYTRRAKMYNLPWHVPFTKLYLLDRKWWADPTVDWSDSGTFWSMPHPNTWGDPRMGWSQPIYNWSMA